MVGSRQSPRQPHPIASGALRFLWGGIGSSGQRLSVVLPRERRHAQADREPHRPAAGKRDLGARQGTPQLVRETGHRRGCHARRDEGELLPADAADFAGRSCQPDQEVRDGPEHDVPTRVTVFVVDPLEPIDVEQDQRQLDAVPPGPAYLGRQARVVSAPVRKARQSIL